MSFFYYLFAASEKSIIYIFQVRHPNILSFLHSTEAEINDGSSTKVTIYIVTEPVVPLAEKIKELGLQGTKRYISSFLVDLIVLLFCSQVIELVYS